MNIIRIILIASMMFIISCSSTGSSYNAAVADSAAGTSEETVTIYGLVKADKENVYISTNWRSKSMVTYTVAGKKKSEIAESAGRYASVSGVLVKKQTWSGVIDVKMINSIDVSPDPKKDNIFNFKNHKKGK